MTEALNPLSLPLHGSALIEASAGTGKTWTIAALVLRIVLGHGSVVQREDRPLLPRELLVMTFTRAATRELSDRIRSRLVEAARVFRGTAQPGPEDEFLQALLAEHPDGPLRETGAWRLETAAHAMDEAAVHTLDAWCQKVLREHAFESDSPLQTEVVPDSSALRLEAARDVWRQEVYPLDASAIGAVRQLWSGPDALAQDAQLAAEKDLPSIAAETGLAGIVETSERELAELKAGWGDRADEMAAWLIPLVNKAHTPYSKVKLKPESVARWLDELRRWAYDPLLERPDLKDANLQRLTPAGLRDAWNKGKSTATPPECFDAMELLIERLAQWHSREPLMRAFAARRVEARLAQLKQHRQLHSHLDVQRQLHEALDEAQHGPPARRLRDSILRRYPVALVDEFQDTSPLQLGILDRLYRIADDDPARLLLLIGDPKQSIYAFRGADIHSYLRAREATAGRHYALAVNHRSTQGLVCAVNRLFACADARPGEGAFRFGSANAANGQRRLPFDPVRAQGRNEVLMREGQPVPALSLTVDTELRGAVEARALAAQRCAQAIVRMLRTGECQFAAPGKPDAPRAPDAALRPGDVAVLVRNRREAAAVREAMAACRLPSVFLSDRDSVFETPEAHDLFRVLQAAAAPRDARLARAALATGLLGLSLAQLQQVARDDDAFDRLAERLAGLLPIWQGQGVLAVVRGLLHRFNLPARWLEDADGERRLTNVLHLGELLQAAAAQHDGLAAQLGWLARQIEDPLAEAGSGEERVLRLESDADRVQVVTVHKAKGLEYPVVFLPFATQVRDSRGRPPWVLWLVDEDGQRRVALEPTSEDRAQAQREEQREDARLLYVALTRARHALWVGASLHSVGNEKANAWHRSALGYLISGDQPCEPAAILRALEEMAAAEPNIQVQLLTAMDHPSQQTPQRWVDQREPLPLKEARPYSATFDRTWSISSYSALVRDAVSKGASHPTPHVEDHDLWLEQERLMRDEPLVVDQPAPAAAPALGLGAEAQPWHHFPRGALAGNFLHHQLEWLAGEGFALHGSPKLQDDLRRRCEREGWGHREADVKRWLSAVCQRSLPPFGTSLHGIQTRLPEMEFWLPSDGLDTARLDALCRQHLLPGLPRPQLAERTLRGLLMGFADLIVEHQGRYWVLDYKSNALGPADGDYGPAAMQRAILDHRYDVQAALYLLPLHRLLRARLGDSYVPQHMLGGAVVFFLRGVAAPTAGCECLHPPLALLDDLDMMIRAGADDERA